MKKCCTGKITAIIKRAELGGEFLCVMDDYLYLKSKNSINNSTLYTAYMHNRPVVVFYDKLIFGEPIEVKKVIYEGEK